MTYTRIMELHVVLKDPVATVDAKADAILEAVHEHCDGAERRRLLCSLLDGFVLPSERKN